MQITYNLSHIAEAH